MKKFEKPEIDIIELNVEDVITTSVYEGENGPNDTPIL